MNRTVYFFIIVLFWSCSKDNSPHQASLSDVHVSKIGLNYIVVATSITNSGNAEILQRGFCWSSTTSNPICDSANFQVCNQNTNQFSDTIRGLTYSTKYYIRSFVKNSAGISYSLTDSITTLESSFKTGQLYQGGYIFYIDSTGEHGLIACKTYGHTVWGAAWMLWKYLGTQKIFGSGRANTKTLLDFAGSDAYAAKFCDDLVFEGYNDWFLPSEDELWLLRKNLHQEWAIIELYPGDIYWSSSEVAYPNYIFASYIETLNSAADFTSDDKDSDHGVIPVRSF